MKSLAIFTSLLSLSSAMQPETDYDTFVKVYSKIYDETDRFGLHPANDTFLKQPYYGIIKMASYPKSVYSLAVQSTDDWNQTCDSYNTTFELEPDGRITMDIEDNYIELRAIENGGLWELQAVDENEPKGENAENHFTILCNTVGSTSDCIIQLIGPSVPYCGKVSDMRPLVLDRGSLDGKSNLILRAKIGNDNQVFTIAAGRPRSFFKHKLARTRKI